MSAPGSKESAKERPRYRSFLGCPATTAVVALLWVLLSFLGYYAFTRDQTHNGSWGCEMAYMYPSYHRVEWPGYDKERYSVYLYREGGVDPGAVSCAYASSSSPSHSPWAFLSFSFQATLGISSRSAPSRPLRP